MQRLEAAIGDVGPEVRRGIDIRIEAQVGEPGNERPDRDLGLKPCHWRPDTEMRSEAEAEMAGRGSVDPELVRVRGLLAEVLTVLPRAPTSRERGPQTSTNAVPTTSVKFLQRGESEEAHVSRRERGGRSTSSGSLVRAQYHP